MSVLGYDEITAMLRPPNDPGWTLVEWAQRTGLNRKTVSDRLEQLVAAGRVRKGIRLVRGKRCNVYCPVGRKGK